MFKEHPRGLIVAFFANMGERFGFYTMMAILVMFLQARYGLDTGKSGIIYSVFYFLIYALALVGGLIADFTKNYKRTILTGIVIMFTGYVLLAIPGMGLPFALFGLFTIALGNGLFKGNLQAVVGQMYDNPKYSKLRDSAYSLFYMGINIGAVFAPNAARGVRTWYLGTHGLKYDADLPAMCNEFLHPTFDNVNWVQSLADAVTGTVGARLDAFGRDFMAPLLTSHDGPVYKLRDLAQTVSGTEVTDISGFAARYLDVFSTGYNFAFGIAAVAMLVSLLVFVLFKRVLPDRGVQKKDDDKRKLETVPTQATAMPWDVEKKRLMALGLVFLVVIFFWMSFHQNGLTMTFFARDFTAKTVERLGNIFFDIKGLLCIASVVGGLIFAFRKGATYQRIIGAAVSAAGAALLWVLFRSYGDSNVLEPEVFQQFNPYFVVFLTPVVVGLFSWLRSHGKEPSTPVKIGIGMILAATGFTMLVIASRGLPSPDSLGGDPSPVRASPYWLILTYFVLTVAELFLSPMGLSYVSKVAPPRFQGLMQGGWLGATAIGNQLLVVGTIMWGRFELWMVWGVFVVCCLISATVILGMSRWLNAMTSAGTAPASVETVPAPEPTSGSPA